MNEFLKRRIERKLDSLPDERAYQVLDYMEFLESKYAERSAGEPSPFQKVAETVEDTLRKGRMSASVIRGTMDAMSSASRVMSGLAAAGKSVVDQVAQAADARRIDQKPASSKTATEPAPAAEPPATSDGPGAGS